MANRRRLTVETLVSAAIEVLDADGVDGFTMRAVATRLGTGAGSLYRHVSSRNELLDLVVDNAIRTVTLPSGHLPWRRQLTELAGELRHVLMSHRDLARIAMTSSSVSANSIRIAETVLQALVSAGCSPRFASIMLDRLSLYVTADAFENSLYRARRSEQESDAYWNGVAQTYAELDPAQYPQLVRHATDLTQPTPDQRFAVGLDTILDGIERALADRARQERPSRSS